jgi:hypothetical protein
MMLARWQVQIILCVEEKQKAVLAAMVFELPIVPITEISPSGTE